MRLFLPFLIAVAVAAQTPLLKHSFDTETEGWMVMGSNGSVQVSKDSKTGAGALQFSYSLDGKAMSTLVLPAGGGRLAQMRRVRFWMKADHDTSIGVVLAEKKPGGGDYAALFWAPKNLWQRVELPLTNFTLNDGPTDAVDSNGKLDPEQVEGIGIVDFATFFNQLPEASPMVVARKTGSHTLLIDDFEILDSSGVPAKAGVIDTFDRGYTEWFTLGGAAVSLSTGDNPLGAPALVASMKAAEGKLTILMRRVNGGDFAGAKRLAFDIAAEHEGTFVISIETKKPGAAGGQGPRYNFMIYPPADRKPFRVNVSLADFDHDDNSAADPAGKLEAVRMKSIAIGDITSLSGGGPAGDNKIWIGRIEMVK